MKRIALLLPAFLLALLLTGCGREAPATPELPKDAETTNPSKPPEYRPEDTEKKPAAESKPQGGGGLPGFDNVPDGGANQGEYVDGDGDINKQVGEMD